MGGVVAKPASLQRWKDCTSLPEVNELVYMKRDSFALDSESLQALVPRLDTGEAAELVALFSRQNNRIMATMPFVVAVIIVSDVVEVGESEDP